MELRQRDLPVNLGLRGAFGFKIGRRPICFEIAASLEARASAMGSTAGAGAGMGCGAGRGSGAERAGMHSASRSSAKARIVVARDMAKEEGRLDGFSAKVRRRVDLL